MVCLALTMFSGLALAAAPATAPSNLQLVSKTSSTVSMSWEAVSGATKYCVYEGATKKGESLTTTFTDGGLTAATEYAYTVKAANNDGEGPASAVLNVTTLAAPDGLSIPLTTTEIVNGATTTFNSLWPVIAFLGGISLAFAIAGRVKRFVRR